MISLEIKTETTTSSLPTGLKGKEEEPSLSFSSLLKGVSLKKDESPKIKDGLNAVIKEFETLEINPKIMQNMSTKEIRTLISDAKEYLKEKILSSDDYKFTQIKDLPKTLKGLSQLAQKLGIDVSKITIESLQVKSDTKTVEAPKEILTTLKKYITPNKSEKTTKESIELKSENKNLEQVIREDKKQELPKIVALAKETPLFKAQTTKEFTTEQLVATKSFKVEEKTPKSRADETLRLLLRGEKPTHTQANITADFSVATAKVIAPSATTEVSKSLESLLRDGSADESTTKLDGLTAHKADSFEVKLNEAKQMIKYLSSDVKSAIEDYKSPFTRVKVQLNPAKLGEVDLTVIARGKNLIVTLSSNNTAINTLSANINELRMQLNNSGINNATFNFNDSSQNSEQNAQQQQRQKEQKADDEYKHFENEEQSEEILSSLEIIVPNYA